jgi:Pyruvate/2-oxoacid:ferredoxin oxidoreductase gamma subunit
LIGEALQHDGFALVDIWELCTAYYAPNNKFGKKEMLDLLEYGGWATGILARNDRPEYARACLPPAKRTSGAASEPKTKQPSYRGQPLIPRFTATLEARAKIVVAGAAGGKVRSTGHLLGRGAVLSGLYATQRDDYPVTVMTGHSVCEVILDTTPIGYTGIPRPDVLIWVADEGRAKALSRLSAMTSRDRAYIAHDLLSNDRQALETQATIIPLDFGRLAHREPPFRVRRQNRAMLALGAVLRREGWYPTEALQAAARETQRAEIAALNLEAIEASVGLIG